MEEVWKAIVIEKNGVIYDYTGLYEVSNLGRIKNCKRETILKPRKNNKGYLYVDLSKDGKQERFTIHRLVAYNFIFNDNPNEKTEVNHKDKNPLNNTVENLERCTREYNMRYSHKDKIVTEETRKKLSKAQKNSLIAQKHLDKLHEDNKRKILCIETNIIFDSIIEASKWCNGNDANIGACCRGKQKTAYGYHWKYIEEEEEKELDC